jgi:hypothetical protein
MKNPTDHAKVLAFKYVLANENLKFATNVDYRKKCQSVVKRRYNRFVKYCKAVRIDETQMAEIIASELATFSHIGCKPGVLTFAGSARIECSNALIDGPDFTDASPRMAAFYGWQRKFENNIDKMKKTLSDKDLGECEAFIVAHDHLGGTEFAAALNRWKLDQPESRSKSYPTQWAVLCEVNSLVHPPVKRR